MVKQYPPVAKPNDKDDIVPTEDEAGSSNKWIDKIEGLTEVEWLAAERSIQPVKVVLLKVHNVTIASFYPTLSPLTLSSHSCYFFAISLDIHLHQSVLLRRLCSSTYSSFLSCSFSFYDDTSFRLGQVSPGPCTLFSSYINHCIPCSSSLTLTYSITPQIYQGLSSSFSDLS